MVKRLWRYLTYIVVVLLGLTVIGFIIRGNAGSAIHSAVALAFLLLLGYFSKKRLHLKGFLIAFIALTLFGHVTIGFYLHAYDTSQVYDKLLHVFGIFSFSILVYAILVRLIDIKYSRKVFAFIMVLGFGLSLGIFVEITEFLSDMFLNTNNQHGLIDTDLDLVSDLIGSLAAGCFLLLDKGKST